MDRSILLVELDVIVILSERFHLFQNNINHYPKGPCLTASQFSGKHSKPDQPKHCGQTFVTSMIDVFGGTSVYDKAMMMTNE